MGSQSYLTELFKLTTLIDNWFYVCSTKFKQRNTAPCFSGRHSKESCSVVQELLVAKLSGKYINNMVKTLLFPFVLLISFVVNNGQRRCQVTSRDVEGPFFEAGAPNVNILAPNYELNDAQTKIKLEGKVLDKNCNPIGNAIVHAWYAGGNPVGYTFPPDYLWYRGYVLTDKNGKYSFEGTYPGTYSGRPIPHIHMKVITDKKELTTQLYFKNDVPPSYEDYVQNRETQFPKRITRNQSGRKIMFDLVIFQ